MKKILLIDDDAKLAEILGEYLERFGFQFESALAPSLGIEKIRQYQPDLLVLDVMLPEKDGFQVCREIRSSSEHYSSLPIIMLTARGEVTDRVVGLELGADDYLAKPFDARELVARIQNLLRRAPAAPTKTAILEFGGLIIDREKQQVACDGVALELTTMEYALLGVFAANPGKTFNRDELMNALRGIDAELFSRAMDTLVSRLRHKLNDTGKPPRFIKTIWGKGYCFIGASA